MNFREKLFKADSGRNVFFTLKHTMQVFKTEGQKRRIKPLLFAYHHHRPTY